MKVAVIGDGGWGTALAMVLNRNGHDTTVWGPFPDYLEEIKASGENKTYLPGVEMPSSLNWISDHAEAVAGAGLVVLVVPSRVF